MAGANPAEVVLDPRAFLDAGFQAASARWNVSGMRPLYRRPFRDPALALLGARGLERVKKLVAGKPARATRDAMRCLKR